MEISNIIIVRRNCVVIAVMIDITNLNTNKGCFMDIKQKGQLGHFLCMIFVCYGYNEGSTKVKSCKKTMMGTLSTF
jgi:hypothetical protein